MVNTWFNLFKFYIFYNNLIIYMMRLTRIIFSACYFNKTVLDCTHVFMIKIDMSLTEQRVRQAKPREKMYFVADDDGLSLKIEPNGNKSWSYRYSLPNSTKRPRVKLGVYPSMSLKEARLARDDKKDEVFGQNESISDVLTFEKVAMEWLDFKEKNALEDRPRSGVLELAHVALTQDILPLLGEKDFLSLKRFDLVQVMRHIESRGVKEPVKKACSYLNQIYDYAVAMGYTDYNLAIGLQKVIIKQRVKQHYPHLQTEDLPEFLNKLKDNTAHPIVKKALWLKLYTGVRGAELLSAEPHHFDLENKIWRIPAMHVKQFRRRVVLGMQVPDYLVPLSDQAVEVVQSAIDWSVGEKYVFASPRQAGQPLHFNTLNTLIRRMGYSSEQLSSHGLRSTLSTILNDSGRFQSSWIEAQLSHTDKDQTRGSYNHAEYLNQRQEMMQWWADYLDNHMAA